MIAENLARDINLPIWEAEWIWNKIDNNNKKSMSRHIKIRKLKSQEKMLKAVTEKWYFSYRGKLLQMTVDFSSETM